MADAAVPAVPDARTRAGGPRPEPAPSPSPTAEAAAAPGVDGGARPPSSPRPAVPDQRAGAAAAGGANPVDLHTHSVHSDGGQTPAELVAEAVARGVRVLGLTDHDTVGGLAEAREAAAGVGIEIVPGVELSTGGQDGEPELHLLGYFFDPTDPALLAGLAAYAEGRLARLERIAERLAALGAPISAARVRELAGPGTVGRPHIARALVEAGHVADPRQAFDRFLASGRPGYAPRPKVEPEEGIALIRGAGGVAVLAHPLGGSEAELAATLGRLVAAGLGGLEVHYGEYDAAARRALAAVAERWGLIATGGSDYHGPGYRVGRELGGPPVPAAAVERLRAAAGR